MHAPAARTMSVSDWALLALLSVIWGGAFFFNKVAVTELPPLTVACGRVGLGALLLYAIVKAQGEILPRGAAIWGAFALMGLFNSVLPFTLILFGQQYVASGLASILIAMTPLFTVVVAHLWTDDDKLTRSRLMGLAAGLLGVAVMVGPDLLRDLGTQVTAQVALLVSALMYAVSGVYGRRFRALPVAATAAGQMLASTIIIVPLVLAIDRPWTLPPPSPAAIGAVLGLAGLCTAIGYLIYFRVLARAGATNLLLVNFMIPASAILLGVAFLHETLEPRQIVGMLFIGLGLAAIDGRAAAFLGRALASRWAQKS
jgi:drug/metabolite transporter (DMT)-like permease